MSCLLASEAYVKAQEETRFNRRLLMKVMVLLIFVMLANVLAVVGSNFFVWYMTNEISLSEDGTNKLTN